MGERVGLPRLNLHAPERRHGWGGWASTSRGGGLGERRREGVGVDMGGAVEQGKLREGSGSGGEGS